MCACICMHVLLTSDLRLKLRVFCACAPVRVCLRACVCVRVCVHLLKYASACVSIMHGVCSYDLLILMNVGIQFENTITSRQATVSGEQFNIRRHKIRLTMKKAFSHIF